MSHPLLALDGVSRSFGAVAALRQARLELYAGQAHALVGENGAGKSTLVKILAGVHTPDTGTLTLDGRPVTFGGPADARAAGIAVIYQEPTLFPDLSVAENIFMGRQPLRGLRRVDVAARVLVMDEPTAALSGVEVERLFAVTRSLRDSGAAVLFISHRFDEVFALCQRITVMRDGQWIATQDVADLSVAEVVRKMVGREISSLYPKTPAEIGATRLEVRNLTRRGYFADVSFTVRSGEIVALAGLVGSGRSEVTRAVFGIDRYDSGEVLVEDRRLPAGGTRTAIDAGAGTVRYRARNRRRHVNTLKPFNVNASRKAGNIEREPPPHNDLDWVRDVAKGQSRQSPRASRSALTDARPVGATNGSTGRAY